MPDLTFRIRWPNGDEEACYSPSSIVRNFYREGETYDLNEFVLLSERAFEAASERVRAVHGYPCSRAASQLATLKSRSNTFETHPDATVTFLRFDAGLASRTSS
ncbi:MSMEG_0570 family nitrogen starvation response protein [uncultured Roseibium sp.]|uniref:MSMEG_0570 family nitrogen starvation response protein n=1 Tax=uncultured Roseibium sp. TaxID=1936171 RepID=UPI002637BBA3|nr:MSMEG_0570 family nitrogen starvation response protein [uncultured Roseibium sp.]